MNPWLTYAQAAVAFDVSKRTLRRWVHDGANGIRTGRDEDGTFLMSSEDLRRVEAQKTAYRNTPTFGRNAV